MFKKLIGLFFLGLVFLVLAAPIRAAEEKKTLYLFWSKTCPHCAEEKVFLKKLVEEYDGRLEVKDFEISSSQENRDLFKNKLYI